MRSLGLILCFTLFPALVGAQGTITVAPGQGFEAERLALRNDTSRIVVVRDGQERPGPLQIETIARGSWRGRAALVHRIRVESSRMTMDDTTWYDPATFAPIAHRSHGPRSVTLDYAAGRVTGLVTEPDSAPRTVDVALPTPVFDPSELHAVLGSIPWHLGDRAELAMFNDGTMGVVPTLVEVEARDTLQTAAGTVDTWRLSIRSGGLRATYWLRVSDGVDLKVRSEFRPGSVMFIRKEGVL